jgi:hypothetical protein
MTAVELTSAEQQRLRELEDSADYVEQVRSDPAAMAFLARPRERVPGMTGEEFRQKYLGA